jgi:hypothetical protein
MAERHGVVYAHGLAENEVGEIGDAQRQSGWPVVTTLNVLSAVPLAVVSSFGWLLVLIGIADQGGTARAYLSGGITLFLPWLVWLASVLASQWLRPRAYAWASLVAAVPLAIEIAVYIKFRG